jgi:hypothetical protein
VGFNKKNIQKTIDENKLRKNGRFFLPLGATNSLSVYITSLNCFSIGSELVVKDGNRLESRVLCVPILEI